MKSLSKIKEYKKILLAIYFLLTLFLVGLLFLIPYLIFYYKNEKPREVVDKEKEENICENCLRRKLDGVYVSVGEENYYPVAVVYDNHSEARPPAGLSKANLVYETEAEGRITRYLAFFTNGEKIEKIGPIRSARPYLLDWANEVNALFVHCGGSPEALAKIAKEKTNNLNEFYNEKSFWRDHSRTPSHNLFTSGEKLNYYLNKKGFENPEYESWKYKDDSLKEKASSSEIFLNYQKPYYNPKWVYDNEKNDYLRYLSGFVHADEDGSEIRAKNIIIQFTATKVLDSELRLRIDNIGKNKAIICLDGMCQAGEWNKKNANERTRFYYENGEEVEFNAGTTWVQVIREGEEVVY